MPALCGVLAIIVGFCRSNAVCVCAAVHGVQRWANESLVVGDRGCFRMGCVAIAIKIVNALGNTLALFVQAAE